MTVNPLHPSLPPETGPAERQEANPPSSEQSGRRDGEGQGPGLPVNDEFSRDRLDPQDQSTWYWPGRYRTPEDLAKAKLDSDQESQRLHHTVETLQREMEQFRSDWESQAANPPEPQGPDLEALKERLTNAGIDSDVFGVFEELANWRAQEIVQQTLAPLAQSAQARNALIGEHPQYAADEQAMWHYLGQNPSVKRKFDRLYGSDPEAALEWAYTRFTSQRQQGAPPPGQGHAGPAPAPPNAMPQGGGYEYMNGQRDNRQHGQVMSQTYRPAGDGGAPTRDSRLEHEKELWRSGVNAGDYSQREYTNSRLDFLDNPNSPGAHPVLAQLAAARGRDGRGPGPGATWNPYGTPPIGGGSR